MDISFYVLLILACMVLLLAMWACAASNVPKWGPDLTLELPPHLLKEAFFRPIKPVDIKQYKHENVVPSAPTDLPYAPLLSNEYPVAKSKPPPPPPPSKKYNPAVILNMDTAVRVLPTTCVPQQKLKPVLYTFAVEESA